jgi:hypothetical protein
VSVVERVHVTQVYTVTKANHNEVLLRKISVLGIKKPPVGAGTYCPSTMLFHPQKCIFAEESLIFYIFSSHAR